MSFLTLAGFELPTSRDSLRELDLSLKTELRTADGTLVRDVRRALRGWSGSTRIVALDHARALKSLLLGAGHTWAFDGSSRYSSKGLALAGAYSFSVSGGKWGGYVTGSTGGATISGLSSYTAWTVAQWVYTGSAWEHRLQTSVGLKYTNGAPTPGASWSYALASGVYTLASGTAIDDLVILPVALPAVLCAQWPQAAPFDALPHLTLAGDLIEDAAVLVQGTGTPELNTSEAVLDGAWTRCATLTFELGEV